MYRLQCNARKNDTESDPRWGWFGSGTETNCKYDITVYVVSHRCWAVILCPVYLTIATMIPIQSTQDTCNTQIELEIVQLAHIYACITTNGW